MQQFDNARETASRSAGASGSTTRRLLRLFARGSHWLHRLTQVAAGAILVVLVVSVFIAVVFRYVLNSPLTWTDELAVSLAVWLTFLGAAVALTENRHFGFDDLVERMPLRLRMVVRWLTALGTVGFLVVMLINGIQVLPILANQRTPTLQVSSSWVYAALPVGCTLMLIQLLGRLIDPFTAADTPQAGQEEVV